MGKKRFIKEKAVFLIYLSITLSFLISSPLDVTAQSNLNDNKACCEVTKSGDSCVYIDKSQCDNNFKSTNTRCEDTSYCTNICCIDSSEGCFPNTPKGLCERKEGTRIEQDFSCNSINECRSGCCVLGGEFVFTSEKQCNTIAKSLFGENNFNPAEIFKITSSENECLELSLAEEEGCCVEDEICSFEKKSLCNGEFNLGKTCSNLRECKNCEPNFKKGCKDGNVYTFDSCGNAERLAEKCDYIDGKLCAENDEGAFCKSLNCASTTEYKDLSYTGAARKHGESWCVYEGPTGDFTDRPGSRQYRFSCLNGEEISEGCRDFRQEVCLQADPTNEFSEASCINNNIYDSEITSDISTVPVGFKFWENKKENTEQCSEGRSTCTVIYVKKNRVSDWECKGSCHCETQEYIDKLNQFCKSKGDCGFSYNILEEKGSGGWNVFWTGTSMGAKPTSFSSGYLKYLRDFGIYGGMNNLNNLIKEAIIDAKSKTDQGFSKDILKYGVIGYLSAGAISTAASAIAGVSVGLSNAVLGTATAGIAGGLGGSSTGAAAIISVIFFWVAIIVAVVAIILSVVFTGGDVRKKTITFECRPWQAPLGGSKCGECTNDVLKECSEYRCKSLGTTCELIDVGLNTVECVDSRPNDINAPKITPLDIGDSRYTLEKNRLGFRIKQSVEPFDLLKFGIKTDEPATCKYDLNNSISYENMEFDFGSSYFKTEHNLSLTFDGNKEYKYFIKCSDLKGNKNNNDYLISFKTKKSPDLTAPIIIDTSIKNNGIVPNIFNQTLLDLALNEPADCRYDKKDQPYDSMNFQGLCTNEFSLIPVNYVCTTALTSLKKGINTFFFRCRDLANNTNTQSYIHSIIRSEPLDLSVSGESPKDSVYVSDVTLNVETSGGSENGKSICRFSEKNLLYEQMIEFKVTDSNEHLQSLVNLRKGNYNYFVKCRDSAGNEDEEMIKFTVAKEGKGNKIVYTYKDFTSLYVVLDVASNCEYNSKEFKLGEGIKMSGDGQTVHTAPLDLNEFNIKCQDDEGKDIEGVKVNV